MELTTSDGYKHAVTFQVDDHPRECKRWQLRDLAQRLRVTEAQLVSEVLPAWSGERLRGHLARFTRAELMPPAFRR